jgi:hypothetical protein
VVDHGEEEGDEEEGREEEVTRSNRAWFSNRATTDIKGTPSASPSFFPRENFLTRSAYPLYWVHSPDGPNIWRTVRRRLSWEGIEKGGDDLG